MDEELDRLRTAAEYQFGRGVGTILLPEDTEIDVRRSSTGRPRQLHADAGRVVTLGDDGRFTLGAVGAQRLHAATEPPRHRVQVGDESVPHVRNGRNAFAKFVRAVDPTIRPRDEVLVVGPGTDAAESAASGVTDTLVAVGRARLPAQGMRDFDSGVAVDVRGNVAAADRRGDHG